MQGLRHGIGSLLIFLALWGLVAGVQGDNAQIAVTALLMGGVGFWMTADLPTSGSTPGR